MKIIILLVIVSLLIMNIPIPITISVGKGLYIVVTFPNLVPDLENIVCQYDKIVSIAPPGVDPHEYSLTTKNVEDLKKADIIISTSHTSFEKRIRELAEAGELNGTLIEIPRIPGIVIKNNPVLKTPNYHMPIYDPNNYILFINYTMNILINKNPSCREIYIEKARIIINKVLDIVNKTSRLNISSIADTPIAQYGVEWVGIRIAYLVVKDPEIQAQPDIETIDKLVSNGSVKLAVVTEPVKSSSSMWLENYASEHGLTILYIPSPLTNASMVDRLSIISSRVNGLKLISNMEINKNGSHETWLNMFSIGAGLALFIYILYVLMERRKR